MIRAYNGFTLIELLIAIAIIGLMIPVLYIAAVTPMRNYEVESRRMVLEGDYDTVHRVLDRDIRSAARTIATLGPLESATDVLILEIPFLESNFKIEENSENRLQNKRVVYRYLKPEGETTKGSPVAPTLLREEYRIKESAWSRVRSYPLSRIVSEVLFLSDDPGWKESKVISVALGYRSRVTHTDLDFRKIKRITMRGATG